MYAERFREFSGLVSRAEKALQRVKTENVKDYGLRGVHVSCLLALHERPEGLTATELASVCGVDRAQISRVTAELRGLDLVCEASPGPRRRYRGALELTEEGRAAAAEMAGIVDEKLQRVSGDIPPEELTVFYRVFGAIVERLEKL
ncbi:MAG TPA: MarR family transcriptional regulator [Candidatus Scatomorpha merdavium]|jgi:DNA-binding MarR family transcriptional regulator|nr:MarR family transcriptional regulator [Oscillospiraceae bacterium]HIS16376.1 MarR family transcriptional regulator [Candidatus Scatomorpha merdavium]